MFFERQLHELPKTEMRSGQISDGYHTFDELYNHRHFTLEYEMLANCYKLYLLIKEFEDFGNRKDILNWQRKTSLEVADNLRKIIGSYYKYRIPQGLERELLIVERATSGRFIEFNGVYCKMLGYTHEELKEQKSMDSVPHENINDVLAIKDKLLREKKALFETTLKRKDSSRIPVEIYAHLIDYEGQPAVLSIVRDITKRKQIENELKKEKKYLEKLLNSLGEAIFTVKMPERIIQAVNDS